MTESYRQGNETHSIKYFWESGEVSHDPAIERLNISSAFCSLASLLTPVHLRQT